MRFSTVNITSAIPSLTAGKIGLNYLKSKKWNTIKGIPYEYVLQTEIAYFGKEGYLEENWIWKNFLRMRLKSKKTEKNFRWIFKTEHNDVHSKTSRRRMDHYRKTGFESEMEIGGGKNYFSCLKRIKMSWQVAEDKTTFEIHWRNI